MEHDEHLHEHGDSLLQEFWALFTDPAHALAELASAIVFDLVVIALVWGVLIKKVIIPKITKKVHAEIDREHGIEH